MSYYFRPVTEWDLEIIPNVEKTSDAWVISNEANKNVPLYIFESKAKAIQMVNYLNGGLGIPLDVITVLSEFINEMGIVMAKEKLRSGK